MTRQKKELEKRIMDIRNFIEVDEELGCGFAPVDAYDSLYEEIHMLEEQLAHLRHFSSFQEEIFKSMEIEQRLMNEGKFHDYLPFM